MPIWAFCLFLIVLEKHIYLFVCLFGCMCVFTYVRGQHMRVSSSSHRVDPLDGAQAILLGGKTHHWVHIILLFLANSLFKYLLLCFCFKRSSVLYFYYLFVFIYLLSKYSPVRFSGKIKVKEIPMQAGGSCLVNGELSQDQINPSSFTTCNPSMHRRHETHTYSSLCVGLWSCCPPCMLQLTGPPQLRFLRQWPFMSSGYCVTSILDDLLCICVAPNSGQESSVVLSFYQNVLCHRVPQTVILGAFIFGLVSPCLSWAGFYFPIWVCSVSCAFPSWVSTDFASAPAPWFSFSWH